MMIKCHKIETCNCNLVTRNNICNIKHKHTTR